MNLVLTAAAITAVAILLLLPVAATLGLLDHPGGRKDHTGQTPVIGGIALFAGMCATLVLNGQAAGAQYFLFACGLVVVVGAIDDRHELSPVVRFGGQITALLVMIFAAGVQLKTVGNLLGTGQIGLWWLAVPLTLFAVVGVINSINMLDGLDGLAGTSALIAFAGYALVAALSGLDRQLAQLLALCGGMAAFLLFNLRLPWQARARTFLGDAGSTLVGFALAWFAVDLTHGPGRTLPPICALWVIVIPLCDTVSLIVRRRRAGRSPFEADRRHLHHLLLIHGLDVGQIVLAMAAASLVTAAIGIGGWWLGVPEPVLFWAFVALYVTYHRTMKAQWRALEADGRVEALPAAGPAT